MGGEGEAVETRSREVGEHAQHVAHQDEGEQREHEGEEFQAGVARGGANHARHEFVKQLGDRLGAARHQRALGHGQRQQTRHEHHRGDHEEAGIGEGQIPAADREISDRMDLELFDRVRRVSHTRPLVLRRARRVSYVKPQRHPPQEEASSLWFMLCAARTTFKVPAAKPINTPTRRPQGLQLKN